MYTFTEILTFLNAMEVYQIELIFMACLGIFVLILFATMVYFICTICFARDDLTLKFTTIEGTGITEKSTTNSNKFIKADVGKGCRNTLSV